MMRTIKFIRRHPLTRANPAPAIARFAAWQIGSRLVHQHVHNWIGGAKLVARNGMTGATGNIYCGLHEFADMGFVLHLLGGGDVFLDVGANIGSYTVLASAVCDARTIAFEPDPDTATHFRCNVSANGIGDKVTLYETALGRAVGEVAFTIGLDTVNKVAQVSDASTRKVPIMPLDAVEGAENAVLIKLDVEGYEAEVLGGGERTLSSPSLLAIETEAQDAVVTEVLEAAGFQRRWYDPISRNLASAPFADVPASNALFVRDEAAVRARLVRSPKRRVLSHII